MEERVGAVGERVDGEGRDGGEAVRDGVDLGAGRIAEVVEGGEREWVVEEEWRVDWKTRESAEGKRRSEKERTLGELQEGQQGLRGRACGPSSPSD